MTLEVTTPETAAPPPPPMDDVELDADATAEAPPRRPARPRNGNVGRPPMITRAERETNEAEGEELAEWLGELAADSSIRIAIFRLRPQLGPNGENIGGSLETVDEKIDEGYLRDTWGGGTFQLKISKPDTSGKWKWFKTKTVKIAGAPKMGGQLVELGQPMSSFGGQAAPASSPLAERAFTMATDMAREERDRADRIAREAKDRGGTDFAAIQMMLAPMQEQLRSAQTTIVQLQTQLIEAVGKPPPTDSFRDKILERAVEGESARIEALRAQYEVRIDKLRDSHDDELKRLEQRHADDLKRLEDRHERELKHRDKTEEQSSKSSDLATATRIDSLKETISRLERELTAATAKIAQLEAKKDQTISDKAEEILKVKEALDGLGGGEDGEEKWYEKVIATVGQLPAVSGALSKLAGAPGAPPAPQPQQLPPPGIPFRGPDGQVYVHDGRGNVGVVNQTQLQRNQAIAAARAKRRAAGQVAAGSVGPNAAPAPEPEDEEGEELERMPNAKDVKLAVTFMENAVRANGTPEAFAQSARSMVPGEVLVFVQRVGIDAILNKVIDANSPLATTRGRQFARKVAALLVGDDPAAGGEATPAETAG